jgi:recombinational DNA repair protein (RecF pathway)
LVVAAVQGVRKSGSKLAMQLSEYAYVSVDLVRGKEVWRLVTIVQIENPFLENGTKTPLELGRSYVRTLNAVERFCQGEEEHEELFKHLVSCLHAVHASGIDPKSFDTLSLWKVLVLLGYGHTTHETLLANDFIETVRTISADQRTQLVKEVNTVIKETQL